MAEKKEQSVAKALLPAFLISNVVIVGLALAIRVFALKEKKQ